MLFGIGLIAGSLFAISALLATYLPQIADALSKGC